MQKKICYLPANKGARVFEMSREVVNHGDSSMT